MTVFLQTVAYLAAVMAAAFFAVGCIALKEARTRPVRLFLAVALAVLVVITAVLVLAAGDLR